VCLMVEQSVRKTCGLFKSSGQIARRSHECNLLPTFFTPNPLLEKWHRDYHSHSQSKMPIVLALETKPTTVPFSRTTMHKQLVMITSSSASWDQRMRSSSRDSVVVGTLQYIPNINSNDEVYNVHDCIYYYLQRHLCHAAIVLI